jgi:hypothetical protein
MPFLIDYVLEESDDTLGGPEGMTVKRNGQDDLAENVQAGDAVSVMPGRTAIVTEVGRTFVNADGTREPRTILSRGA